MATKAEKILWGAWEAAAAAGDQAALHALRRAFEVEAVGGAVLLSLTEVQFAEVLDAVGDHHDCVLYQKGHRLLLDRNAVEWIADAVCEEGRIQGRVDLAVGSSFHDLSEAHTAFTERAVRRSASSLAAKLRRL